VGESSEQAWREGSTTDLIEDAGVGSCIKRIAVFRFPEKFGPIIKMVLKSICRNTSKSLSIASLLNCAELYLQPFHDYFSVTGNEEPLVK
jgi:hypothetical protein